MTLASGSKLGPYEIQAVILLDEDVQRYIDRAEKSSVGK
jgi:hypothetical protein